MLKQLAAYSAVLVIFFILFFIYTKLAGPIPFYLTQVSTSKTDTFNVSGEGKVSVKPDLAVVTVGVNSESSTIKAAQDQLNASINKVSDAIKKLGIEGGDIQTENYNVNPKIDYSGGYQKQTGYQANTNLRVKVKRLDKANAVIDAATTNGATQVGGINFEVADKAKAEDQARKLAVENAKKKASMAAQTAGFRLGRLVNYSENSGGQPPIVYAKDAVSAQGGTEPTKVEPGSTDIKITVTLSYQID